MGGLSPRSTVGGLSPWGAGGGDCPPPQEECGGTVPWGCGWKGTVPLGGWYDLGVGGGGFEPGIFFEIPPCGG